MITIGYDLVTYSTSRYLDDLLNIDNPYFEQIVGKIYPTELQLNKANLLILKLRLVPVKCI